jgi:cytochrome c oxidase subunit 3
MRETAMAEAHTKHHDYHLVDPSPWPVIGAVGAFLTAIGLIYAMHATLPEDATTADTIFRKWGYAVPGFLIVLYTMYAWWSDVIKEAHRGDHTRVVQLHLRYGMIMFIASEVMFFVAWFWAFFDASLYSGEIQQVARVQATGGQWPPAGMEVFDPWHLPLLNTLILLTSGTTVTWAHHALLHNDRKGLVWGLTLTIILGALFTAIQAYEYASAPFAFSGNIYGATFFMATGFHGAHVIIGTIFLTVCLVRALNGHFRPEQHFGFEAAAWYWHFVDVVWLFLFACIYVWGNSGGHYH